MSPRAALTRRTASAIRSEPCVFCVAHQLRRPVHHNALRQIDSRPRTSSSGRSLTCFSESIRSAHHRPGPQLVKKPRGKPLTLEEYESTNRIGVYTMFQQGGNLSIKPEVANQIVKEFMAPKSDPVARVKQLAEGYKTELSELTKLAHGLWLIRHIKSRTDSTGLSRYTSFQRVAKELFVALSGAKEPEATLQIMRGAYLSAHNDGAKNFFRNFSPVEVRNARKVLEELAVDNKNPEAMTLVGVFLEKDGFKDEAQAMYHQAMDLSKMEVDVGVEARKLGLPQIAPWNALGFLLKSKGDAGSLEQAKEVFKKGALEGDDPVSYYELAMLGEPNSGDWLQYMQKAAGAGHLDAIHALGKFYLSTEPEQVAESKDRKLMTMLKWIFSLGKGRTEILGMEYLTEGVNMGHKPSMMTLVSYLRRKEDAEKQEGAFREQIVGLLEQVRGSPEGDKVEQWPELVVRARKQLQEMNARR